MFLTLNSRSIEYVESFVSLVDRYDAFLVDIWGVLHDSATAYPGAVDCLQRIKGNGKKVILVSNAGRRAAVLGNELLNFEITDQLYNHIVSSGELAWNAFSTQHDDLKKLGTKYYLMGRESYRLTDGLVLQRVHRLAEADFILNISVVDNSSTIEDYDAVLHEAVNHQLTMVCANPDLMAVRSGVMGIAAGTVAKKYGQLGGTVVYFGKPHLPTYQACFELLGNIAKNQVLAVGDALNTDVAGANEVGIDSALVSTGIHAAELSELPLNTAPASDLFSEFQEYPKVIVPAFRW